MKIKVCGMRDEENILNLYEAGIRMMGFIFYNKSKRNIDLDRKQELFSLIPPDVKKVGVFVNESQEFIRETVVACRLDYVQLHGDEDPTFCAALKPYAKVIKAFRVDEDFDFELTEAFQELDYLLFDAKGKDYGGNGIKYSWDLLKQYKYETPFLLSGGITPDDVDKILAFEHSKFIGIDINSGFEIEPGLKNIDKIRTFTSYLRCSTQ